ncbi:MAG: (2Fe-2S)-binding protein [Elusimicrobiales bacterium]|nr:(2Fe-2S)-binding protein [Elusimicrobiales bacterium]
MKYYYLRCVVNGKKFNGFINPNLKLIEFLRDVLKLKGTKKGCEQGECGSCIVLVNNKMVNSCLVMAFQVDGKKIITIEGVDKIKYSTSVKKALREEGAVQCGFCIPAIVIAATDLIKNNKKITENDVKKHFVGNICRCSGYDKIFKAVWRVINDKRSYNS